MAGPIFLGVFDAPPLYLCQNARTQSVMLNHRHRFQMAPFAFIVHIISEILFLFPPDAAEAQILTDSVHH